jgi:hypothetical protein
MNKKTWLMAGVAALAVVVAIVVALKSTASEGNVQSNVADFAKSIDQTKADTPSVPPERLALGRSGPMKGRAGK